MVSTFLLAFLTGFQSKLISEQVLEGDSIKIKVNTRGTFGNNVRGSSIFICTENFRFNLNADYVLADGGNQYSYGGGFRLVFWNYLICNTLHNQELKNYLLFFRLNKVPKFNRCLIDYWIDFKRNS